MALLPRLLNVLLVAAVLAAGCRTTPGSGDVQLEAAEQPLEIDPANATCGIEGRAIALVDGHAWRAEAPGGATRARTSLLGNPLRADLDGDGDDDAVVLLRDDPGGSGTFTYVAAALWEDGGYRGTNAALIGDRIDPNDLRVANGVIEVRYRDRAPGEPMTAAPTVERRREYTLEAGALVELPPLGPGERVEAGWVVIGHELRSFSPCSGSAELWLRGDSPALADIAAAHARALPDAKPYAPLFVVLAGRPADRPGDGFGAEFAGAFMASRLWKVPARGGCHSGLIVTDSPAAGEVVTSPLPVRGRARGMWFFEGDFPIALEDARGNVIAEGFASAAGEWMTEQFVPFAGSLEFEAGAPGERGTLILHKDNPSDRRELDAAVKIPIVFR